MALNPQNACKIGTKYWYDVQIINSKTDTIQACWEFRFEVKKDSSGKSIYFLGIVYFAISLIV